MSTFTLHIPKDIEAQLRRCRTSIRQSIRKRLEDITESLSAGTPAQKTRPPTEGPPLRFYVFDGYRVSYHINPVTRRVLVLNLQAETG